VPSDGGAKGCHSCLGREFQSTGAWWVKELSVTLRRERTEGRCRVIYYLFILFDAHFTQFQRMYRTGSETIANMKNDIPRHQMKALTGIALPYITQVTVKAV